MSWRASFEILFRKYPIKRVLEFGEGEGTRWLLDNCDFVCSVEAVAADNHREWVEECKRRYSGDKNWKQLVYQCPPELIAADGDAQRETYTSNYLHYIENIASMGLGEGPFDLAFVDYGLYLRGSLVNFLWDKVSIIAAHDTSVDYRKYGWHLVAKPDNYEELSYPEIPDYPGTKFWIRKDTI